MSYRGSSILVRAIGGAIRRSSRNSAISQAREEQSEANSNRVKQLFQNIGEKTGYSKKSVAISATSSGGHEFEDLVASLLRGLGFVNVKVTSRGADGGVDISAIHETKLGTTVKFFIECKHQPQTAIGRPVVQKLDSAVKNGKADKGMVITSGRFSRDAIEYSKEVGIDLIDGSKLKKILQNTGINLETNVAPSETTPINSWSNVEAAVLSYFKQRKIENLSKIELKPEQIVLMPMYLVSYSINATFTTSVGVIRSIAENGKITLDDDGDKVEDWITEALVSNQDYHAENSQTAPIKIIPPAKLIPIHKLDQVLKEFLANKYTQTVSYVGNNGSRYAKVCVPQKRDIEIVSIKQYLIPQWQLTAKLNGRDYGIEVIDLFAKTSMEMDPTTKCALCSEEKLESAAICSECKVISCKNDTKSCKICDKILCKNCTKWKKKWLILADAMCSKCYDKQENK